MPPALRSKGKSASIQMVILDLPQGEIHYLVCASGTAAPAPAFGHLMAPEVTIRQSYETSAQVNTGELDGQKAFTQGKVKIGGKMLKMMQLRGPLAQIQTALARIDTEY